MWGLLDVRLPDPSLVGRWHAAIKQRACLHVGRRRQGAPPLTVKWTSTVEDGTPPYTYKWDFGDGTPASTEANPTHIYAKEGEFTATLSVSDSKGLTGSEEYDILVEKEEE